MPYHCWCWGINNLNSGEMKTYLWKINLTWSYGVWKIQILGCEQMWFGVRGNNAGCTGSTHSVLRFCRAVTAALWGRATVPGQSCCSGHCQSSPPVCDGVLCSVHCRTRVTRGRPGWTVPGPGDNSSVSPRCRCCCSARRELCPLCSLGLQGAAPAEKLLAAGRKKWRFSV